MILGLNKYTHSTSAALFENDGRLLFALSKERVTRKKHDGGDVAELVRYALESTKRKLSEIELVVQNNHLFDIAAYEKTLSFTEALHAAPPSSLDPHNLFPKAKKLEISHHLAHAWSVFPIAPFDRGLVVVMDGMGSPENLVGAGPRPARTLHRREGETVYRFDKNSLKTIYKRWIEERSPSFLYNYGFENMESLGAIYSRISSHIFGDWNACGKVMGLAAYGDAKKIPPILEGELESLIVNWELLHSLEHPNDWRNEKNRRFYENLAARVQADLERVALTFFKKLRRETSEKNLCFTGGVALNSVLNGRILREAGFEQVFIPNYPGDEGVAFGCGHFGIQKGNRYQVRSCYHGAYTGRSFSPQEIREAIHEFAPWIQWKHSSHSIEETARALAKHKFVGWFQGRSEFGPRALGNRSILSHPGKRSSWERLNLEVKQREPFRPFAPTVLAERTEDFFCRGGACAAPTSSYMSFTFEVNPKRAKEIAAVAHVDNTARIQTLKREDNTRYYDLLSAFEKLTGLPLLLNTSFNIDGEPIVESPQDALRAFLYSGLHLLVLEDFLVEKRSFPSKKELANLYPQAVDGILIESRSQVSGEIDAVQISLGGTSFETDELSVLLLEASTGELAAPKLLNLLRKESKLSEKALIGKLQELWRRRAIAFKD